MEVLDAIRTRRSIRKFKPDPIPDEDVRRLIEAATLAPNAGNDQPWRFIAVSNRDVLARLKEIIIAKLDSFGEWPESAEYKVALRAAKGYSGFFADAPVTIVVLGEPYLSPVDEILAKRGWTRAEIEALRQSPGIQSVSAAIENLCLAAVSMGYGTCWMTAPCLAQHEIKEALGIEPPWEVVAFVPVGVPDYEPPSRPRKPVEEVLEFMK